MKYPSFKVYYYSVLVLEEVNLFPTFVVLILEVSSSLTLLRRAVMKRLYYLTKNINIAQRVSDRLHEEGITDWNFHVLGKDKADVIRHQLHSTTPLQELDIIRSGERGVLAGFTFGVVATMVIAMFTSIGEYMGLLAQLATIVLFSLFGAWLGGLVGVSSENYKIRRFHDDIEAGYFLLMIDVQPHQISEVREVVVEFDQIRQSGEDSTFDNPFASAVVR